MCRADVHLQGACRDAGPATARREERLQGAHSDGRHSSRGQAAGRRPEPVLAAAAIQVSVKPLVARFISITWAPLNSSNACAVVSY